MKISIDVKSMVIGFLLGAVVFVAMGQVYSGAGKADFGIAVDDRDRSSAIIRSNDGTLYVIEPRSAKAEIIEYDDGPFRGRAFNLNRSLLQQER